jgi:hypothetical protein
VGARVFLLLKSYAWAGVSSAGFASVLGVAGVFSSDMVLLFPCRPNPWQAVLSYQWLQRILNQYLSLTLYIGLVNWLFFGIGVALDLQFLRFYIILAC